MIPIRDHNPSTRLAWVTWLLMAANIAVHLAGMVLITTERELIDFYTTYAMVPARISNGENYLSLVTSTFVHGDLMHLAGNMLFLWIFGDNLEDRMGHLPYLGFYLASGVAAALAQIVGAPGSMVPMVGASGAIAGVMGGYLLLFPRARVDIAFIIFVIVKIVTVPAWLTLGLWFGLQLVNGAASTGDGGGVAYWAHAGGFIAGVVLTVPVWLRVGGPGFWARTSGHPPHQETRPTGGSVIPRVVRSSTRKEPRDLTSVPRAGRRRTGRRSPWGGSR